ncbi:hypothetical protein [Paractinoplanes brasiliensis]|uniref:Uncharacterized protein n=1 Tax=Paractinoplanes brasiliensis TaxID=52695 RepID=A0A4R6JWR5_9ACTN|nr:hypothetical protein [Actinoplanes brasiliensis]TDO40302.1 hypothetical protein C8E87_4013 [Actinoplanes brasiliensis]GID25366.1 hypothetical protein Abr02nite_03490 [Actinoplanes brasiliensis]
MRQQRWFPIAALAIGLFAINAVARLVTRFGFDNNDDAAGTRATVIMFALIGAVLAVYAFSASRGRPPSQWLVPDWALGVAGAMVLTLLVGPFISGSGPFSGGSDRFFAQIALYAAFAGGGTLVGYWISVALGLDYRSRSLKAFTETRMAKPRRPVRR